MDISIFNCLNPIYAMTELQKKTCPETIGKIWAVIIFIICLFFGYSSYNQNVKDYEKQGSPPGERPELISTMFGFFVCGLFTAVVFYYLIKFSFNIQITQNESMINAYMNTHNYDRSEAIRELARIRQNQNLANAMRSRR